MMQDQEALENAMNSASGKIQGTLKSHHPSILQTMNYQLY